MGCQAAGVTTSVARSCDAGIVPRYTTAPLRVAHARCPRAGGRGDRSLVGAEGHHPIDSGQNMPLRCFHYVGARSERVGARHDVVELDIQSKKLKNVMVL